MPRRERKKSLWLAPRWHQLVCISLFNSTPVQQCALIKCSLVWLNSQPKGCHHSPEDWRIRVIESRKSFRPLKECVADIRRCALVRCSLNISTWAAGPKVESIWDVEDDSYLKATLGHLSGNTPPRLKSVRGSHSGEHSISVLNL